MPNGREPAGREPGGREPDGRQVGEDVEMAEFSNHKIAEDHAKDFYGMVENSG